METVRVFNQELSGLYEAKPPISKAKMASITRSAMKAIKFYKHVVQSVEKFISKCKSEYKIPGLYVIDSIVRQSRHQFGPEKDVFAPRFARNMEQTFAHLFRCPPEDKSKIIRVLNLWQKNMVFAPEVIQPLFDLANPEHPLHQQYNASQAAAAAGGAADLSGGSNGMNTSVVSHDSPAPMSHDDLGSATQQSESKGLDPNTIRQLQQFQQLLLRQTSGSDAHGSGKDQVKFNKKLLDFDYGSEEDDDKNSPSVPSTSLPDGNNIAQILSDPNVLKQLQNLQKLKQHEMEEKQTKLTEMRLQEEKFEKHLASVLKKLPFANECDLSRQPTIDLSGGLSSAKDGDGDDIVTEVISDTRSSSPRSTAADQYKSSSSSRRRKSRSRSRSRDRRDRDRNRRRSRSRSRSGSHSRARGRGGRGSTRDRERDRASQKDKERDKERERERKKRGLPEIKKEHLSVCSTTLWVGHLSKLVQQEELSDTFGKYGDIVSIDLIPPRGCAFIVMNRRQDAYKSMQNLKNHKMHGRTITISWATGKGVKGKEWKDYWDIDLGCSYIPWSKLDQKTDLESLEEGGMLDDETMPQWMKDKIANASKKKEGESASLGTPLYAVDTSQPPPTAAMMAGMTGMPAFTMGAVGAVGGVGAVGAVGPVAAVGAVPRLPIMGLPIVPGMGINVPPPNLMMAAGGMNNPPPLPMGAGFGVLPPPPPSHVAPSHMPGGGDEMDIEMEDESSNQSHAHPPVGLPPVGPPPGNAAFFNQPPPPLMPPNAMPFNRNHQENNGGDRGGFNRNDNPHDQDRRNRGDFDRRGGGRDRERGGRDDRGDRGRDDRGRDDRGRRNFRDNDGGERNERPSRWGSNDRNNFGNRGGSDGGRDERPLSERLRELAGADFSQHQQRGGDGSDGQQQFGGGRNFRGGRNNMNDGDDFNNRGGNDFGGRGNFNQGGRFNNNQRGGGRFNNRGGGFMQNRGGPDGDNMQAMNIMSLLNIDPFFGGNNNNNNDQGGGDDDQQQQQFFDRGNDGGNFNNRRSNNWNDGMDRGGNRGNRGGRGNWRDNNDDGDGGRFGNRRNDQRNPRHNDFGGNQDEHRPQQQQQQQPQQQQHHQQQQNRNQPAQNKQGLRWDENDENWDDDVPPVVQKRNVDPPKEDRQEQQQDTQQPQHQEHSEETQGNQDSGKRNHPTESRIDDGGEWDEPREERIEGGKKHGGGGTPLFDEMHAGEQQHLPPQHNSPERHEQEQQQDSMRNPSPPPVVREPEPEPRQPSPEQHRPQLYSPSPPPPAVVPEAEPVFEAPAPNPEPAPEPAAPVFEPPPQIEASSIADADVPAPEDSAPPSEDA